MHNTTERRPMKELLLFVPITFIPKHVACD